MNLPTLTHTHPLAVAPLPPLVERAGPAARFAWDEFFQASIRNAHTRTAYARAVRRFLAWLDPLGVELAQVTPAAVAAFLDQLPLSPPAKKLTLAALRRFFDALVLRHVIVLNPALSVRGERHQVVEGRTPEISPADARRLLDSIEVNTPVGRRDRAVIACLVYTAARVGAVANLKRHDWIADEGGGLLRFTDKGGKRREIPVRFDLDHDLREYTALLPDADHTGPLFRSLAGKSGRFTARSMSGTDILRMVKRRLKAAGLSSRLCPHSFRVCAVTDLLSQGVPLADVQYLAGHADPRTTRLYDRRQQRVTRNIVERISV